MNLCVTFKGGVEDVGSKFKLDLNKEPWFSSDEDGDGRPNENLALFVGTDDTKRNVVLGKKTFDDTKTPVMVLERRSKNYEGGLEGHKPNDIINIIRTEYGCDLTYSQAWESREYAVNEVRGIPENSYGKNTKVLVHDTRSESGGFYKGMRKVIVVDGTFLKNKYKGVMLVATAVDGNSNLYPIAFGIADSENDSSWEWFFEQIKVVIRDDKDLSFISDRHVSISKSLEKIYLLSTHGICIHHLIGNVITYHKGRGVADLVSRASKAYRVAEFEKHFGEICNISPVTGEYLEDAQVKKWVRCHFHGYRYDLNTKNAAESINSALRSPREYSIIPLLDSIREMLTRWFIEQRELSAKQKDPLTVKVENKISRRIGKGKYFKSYRIGRNILQVKANRVDFVVDLERRTCSCGKFQMGKIPCRHAIKGAFDICTDLYRYADDMYSPTSWREYYEETVNPIGIPENEWGVPDHIEAAKVLPPETRRHPGRQRKRRHETVEDKIRASH
ncbi:PREDICTED: uncharacterized protein LOC104738409 [Camelina sativa]|uniref:Uncharacterized protein LOC104738409 n=1 Tax=Camelina sativa TaxID=90675 RepID=A0ABM0VIV4_CAMSA|nr:PREDICTED: uncharacterized protein LOC104738409 [Camelina sativa]